MEDGGDVSTDTSVPLSGYIVSQLAGRLYCVSNSFNIYSKCNWYGFVRTYKINQHGVNVVT